MSTMTLRALLLLFVLIPSLSEATTWYVNASTGDDMANDCTDAQDPGMPKLTITSALGCVGFSAGAGANDVVEVANGT